MTRVQLLPEAPILFRRTCYDKHVRIRVNATTGEAIVESVEDASTVEVSVARPPRRKPELAPGSMLPPDARRRTAAVLASVCEYTDVTMEQLMSNRRHPAISQARHIAFYFLHEQIRLSYPEIGRIFGKHHTSVMHGVKVVRASLEREGVREMLGEIQERSIVS